MDLIIGGAYQGKLRYAKQCFSLTKDDIFVCAEQSSDGQRIDTGKRCIVHLERYLYDCVKLQTTPVTEFRSDAVLIADDIFSGVVPTDDLARAWRETAGRYLTNLAGKADTVTRVFCGIPQRLR